MIHTSSGEQGGVQLVIYGVHAARRLSIGFWKLINKIYKKEKGLQNHTNSTFDLSFIFLLLLFYRFMSIRKDENERGRKEGIEVM